MMVLKDSVKVSQIIDAVGKPFIRIHGVTDRIFNIALENVNSILYVSLPGYVIFDHAF